MPRVAILKNEVGQNWALGWVKTAREIPPVHEPDETNRARRTRAERFTWDQLIPSLLPVTGWPGASWLVCHP